MTLSNLLKYRKCHANLRSIPSIAIINSESVLYFLTGGIPWKSECIFTPNQNLLSLLMSTMPIRKAISTALCSTTVRPSTSSPSNISSELRKSLPPNRWLFHLYEPWHFLYFLPLPHQQGSFLPSEALAELGRPILSFLSDIECLTELLKARFWTFVLSGLCVGLPKVRVCAETFDCDIGWLCSPIFQTKFAVYALMPPCKALNILAPSFLYSIKGSRWP